MSAASEPERLLVPGSVDGGAAMEAEQRVLILAPLGREEACLAEVVAARGFEGVVCRSVQTWRGAAEKGALLTIVTEEALTLKFLEPVVALAGAAPDWSSPTYLVLVDDAANPPSVLDRMLAEIPTISCLVLQRPVGRQKLDAAITTQTRHRQRQYQVRDLIEELQQREEQQRFLRRELDHRVRNTLNHLQSLLSLSARHTDSVDQLVEGFSGRIQALSRTYQRLGRGAEATTLAELVESVTEPYRAARDRISVEGPELTLSRKLATSFTMVLHELATNASKYGALSVSQGRVTVCWSRTGDGDGLVFEWREADGPKVEPPTGEGFGTQMLKQIAAMELNASPELTYAPDGLCYRLVADRLPAK